MNNTSLSLNMMLKVLELTHLYMSVEEMLTAVCAFVLFCTQAIPDTQLTIRKYADTKFEYLVCMCSIYETEKCMYMPSYMFKARVCFQFLNPKMESFCSIYMIARIWIGLK